MQTDVWQALTKAALRLVNEHRAHDRELDAEKITEAALRVLDDLTDVGRYRSRLKAFVRDISHA